MPTSSLKLPTSVPLRNRFLEWITCIDIHLNQVNTKLSAKHTQNTIVYEKVFKIDICCYLLTLSGSCQTWHPEERGSQRRSTEKKGKIWSKNYIRLKTHPPQPRNPPQTIQDVDEFVSSSDLEKCVSAWVSQQWMLCSEWVPSEWESDKNITIIHTTPVHQLMSWEDKTCL